jgi:hypothetical protein
LDRWAKKVAFDIAQAPGLPLDIKPLPSRKRRLAAGHRVGHILIGTGDVAERLKALVC